MRFRTTDVSTDINTLRGCIAQLNDEFASVVNQVIIASARASSPPAPLARVSLPDDLYASDEFRMYTCKVQTCMRADVHDWTECPFAHPGEKWRRRDPRKFKYLDVCCPQFGKRGYCAYGDACTLSHGVHELWLHPARYRTRMCRDGAACSRALCFFAHNTQELRGVA